MNQRGLDNQYDGFVSAKDAARLLGVKLETVYAYAARGWLGRQTKVLGKRSRYSRAAIERLKLRALARSGHGPVAAAALRWGDPVLDTAITELTPLGPKYRGALAIELARDRASFESVAERLWGSSASETWNHVSAFSHRTSTEPTGPGRSVLRLAALLSTASLDDSDHWVSAPVMELDRARRIIRFLSERLGPTQVAWKGSIAATALTSLRGSHRAPEADRLLIEAALVLCADHELNSSTFTARIAASTGATLDAALVAALGTLSGPLHGGACDRADAFIREAIDRGASEVIRARSIRAEALPGFEVHAYPDGDPRAVALLEALDHHSGHQRARADVKALHETVKKLTGAHPSVDFALSAVTHVLGLPSGSAAALFALGRTAGWVAHIQEQRRNGAILRPRARFVPPAPAPHS